MDKLLTVPQVAERLRIERVRAYELVKAGEIPAIKLSPRRIRIRESALEKWLQSKKTNRR